MTDEVDLAPVLTPLEDIQAGGFSRYDVFRDWVRLMLAALQRDDDQYLDILDDYDRGRDLDRGDRPADLFTEAFGELQSLMADTNLDVLGMAYEEFGMGDDTFGQHFTPHHIATRMIEMVASDGDPEPPVTIADPACGSGRTLVLAARHHDVPTICFGQDKDPLCAQMAALNLCFFNIDGVVVCGDTLTLEKLRAWETRGTVVGGEVREVDPTDVAWPEAAFETKSNPAGDHTDAAAEERLNVDPNGGDLDQSELGAWLD